MSPDPISLKIAKGEYEEAKHLIDNLDEDEIERVYLSKIAELTGNFEQALQIARKHRLETKKPEMKFAAAIMEAYAYWRLLDLDAAHEILNQVSHHQEMASTKWRGTYHNIRGLIYWKEDNTSEAIASFTKALQFRERLENSNDKGYTLNNLGNTYLKIQDIEKSREYYQEAREIRNQLGYLPAIAASHNSFGRLFDHMKLHTKATREHNKCLHLWKKIGNSQFEAKAYRYLAINMSYRGEEDKARDYMTESDKLFTEIGNEIDVDTNSQLKSKLFTHL